MEEIVHSMEECKEKKIVSVVDECKVGVNSFSGEEMDSGSGMPVRWNGPWDGGKCVGRNSLGDVTMHIGGNL